MAKSEQLQGAENADGADWEEARRRASVVERTLDDATGTARLTAAEASDVLGVSRTTIYEWRARYSADRRVSSLLPRQKGRPIGRRPLDARIDAIIAELIDTFYLRSEKPRISDLMGRIHTACHNAGLTKPAWRTVKRRIGDLDLRDATLRREGVAAAIALDPAVGSYSAALPLDVVQIDHTVVDVFIVDEISRQVIDRPVLTLAIDVCTRMVTGYYVGLDDPSTTRTGVTFAHSVFEKDKWLSDRNVDLPWPVAGLPRSVHVDNGPDFRGHDFTRALEDFSVKVIHRPIARPHYGGHIERLIGTTMGALHLLPGSTFSNVQKRGRYPSEARASLTLKELDVWLAYEILGKYHNRVHSALKRPPAAVWAELAPAAGLRMPSDRMAFLVHLLPSQWRLVRRDGVHLFGVRYWSDALTQFIGRDVGKLQVRYDPRDLSSVYVRLPGEDRYVEANYADTRRAPVTLWELRRATSRLTAQGRREANEDVIFKSIDAQRAIEDAAVARTKLARKAVAVRPSLPSTPKDEAVDLGTIDSSDPALQTFSMEMIDDPRRRR